LPGIAYWSRVLLGEIRSSASDFAYSHPSLRSVVCRLSVCLSSVTFVHPALTVPRIYKPFGRTTCGVRYVHLYPSNIRQNNISQVVLDGVPDNQGVGNLGRGLNPQLKRALDYFDSRKGITDQRISDFPFSRVKRGFHLTQHTQRTQRTQGTQCNERKQRKKRKKRKLQPIGTELSSFQRNSSF